MPAADDLLGRPEVPPAEPSATPDPALTEALRESIHIAVERELGALEVAIAARYGPFRVENDGVLLTGPRGPIPMPATWGPNDRRRLLDHICHQLNLAYAEGLIASDAKQTAKLLS